MMNIPPSEARELTLAEYQGILHNWNRAQGGEEELEPPTQEKLAERRARLEARGIKVLH
jgi:hypothetical protein